MAGGFLSRIFGGGNKGGSGPDTAKSAKAAPWGKGQSAVEAAFAILDTQKRGLAKRTAQFIETGEGRTVLSDLEALRSGPRAGNPNFDYNAFYKARNLQSLLMVRLFQYPDMLARMAEVHAAQEGPSNKTYTLGSKSKFDAPDAVHSLLHAVNQLRNVARKETGNISEITIDSLVEAVRLLGGRVAHIIQFDLSVRYGQRLFLPGGRPVSEYLSETASVDDIVHAFQQMDAGTRAHALGTFSRYDRATDKALAHFLMAQLAGTSSKCREEARAILARHDPKIVEPLATEALNAGKAALRSEGAILLGEIGTETAKASLAARLKKEKTASVVAVIEQYLGASAAADIPEAEAGTYAAADGSIVQIPEFFPMEDDGSAPLDETDRKDLARLREAHDAQQLEHYKNRVAFMKKNGHSTAKMTPPKPMGRAADAYMDWVNAPIKKGFTLKENQANPTFFNRGYTAKWLAPRLEKLPLKRVVQLAVLGTYQFNHLFSRWNQTEPVEQVVAALEAGQIDLRHVIHEATALEVVANKRRGGYVEPGSTAVVSPASFIEAELASSHINVPNVALWPLVAEYLPTVIDSLPPLISDSWANLRALKLLSSLPKLPAAAVQPILFCAISERRNLREAAQAMLVDVEGIDDRLIEVLADKRQAIRGNAARFLADRGAAAAIPHLEKRLKKERSESAKAEMISAIARLGGDTTPFLGQAALTKEAEAIAKKLPGAKMDWLSVDQAPPLRWANGKAAPAVLTEAWMKLALKLKDPAGSPLFGLYFDQMVAEDVTALSDWILSSWIGYDTDRPPVDELRKKAREQADVWKGRGSYYSNMTIDQLTEMFLRPMLSSYANSGSDSKGLLALTHRGTPGTMTQRIQAYLKNHGKRVSQAKALVEVLAATGTPESLQVLVATATRFKQRTVRELAEQLVTQIASDRGWTEDELADRSVPSGGFEEDGTLTLEIGEEGKEYVARLGEDLTVKLFNPDGKAVKALPAGKDEATKESKKLLSAAKKTVKTVTAQQADRLYGAMVAGRMWPLSDWTDDIRAHPILSRLSERVIWLGYGEDKTVVATFRPTPEGDLLDAEGEDADLSAVAHVALAHTSHIDEDLRQAWVTHLADFEVNPLFGQISRPMQILSEAQKKETALKDREGWLMDTFTLRGLAGKAGFERGPVEDGAGFHTYVKPFRSAGMHAVLEFTGSYLPEENLPAAIIAMTFVRGTNSYGKAMKLGDVPPILLSEVWADLYQIAESGAFDPEWRKKGLY